MEAPPDRPEAAPASPLAAEAPAEIKTAPVPVETAPDQPEPATEAQPKPVEEPVQEQKISMSDAEPFSVQFAPRGIVWIYMTADDEKTIDITLREGERYRIEARKLEVRLGKPSLVDITFNGVPVPIDSTPGKPLNLVFPDCIRQSP